MTDPRRTFTAAFLLCVLAHAFDGVSAKGRADARAATIARAKVWAKTDVKSMNLRTGPRGPGAFAPGATVECDYRSKELSGNSPKFACAIGKDDEVKVKFGGSNAEVYGEVAATRLLWAIGFTADRMYPVRVVCRGCPRELGGLQRVDGTQLFDPAVIERKTEGHDVADEAWAWGELDAVDHARGGASLAERDALRLAAVFLQHTDTKPEQQRVICLVALAADDTCARPVMMINDLGLTFGRAGWANDNGTAGANLVAWSRVPVWKGETGCVGNLPRSLTGTLEDPVISEAGRKLLASLLLELSDRQIRDLFEVARFDLRPREPGRGRSGFPAIDEWVDAFKQRRQQIVDRRCPA